MVSSQIDLWKNITKIHEFKNPEQYNKSLSVQCMHRVTILAKHKKMYKKSASNEFQLREIIWLDSEYLNKTLCETL